MRVYRIEMEGPDSIDDYMEVVIIAKDTRQARSLAKLEFIDVFHVKPYYIAVTASYNINKPGAVMWV